MPYDPTCQVDGCNKRRSYNFPSESQGKFCAKHREPNMICVTVSRCREQGCTKRPFYNYAFKKALYCARHKRENMVDVKHKRCKHRGCHVQPFFNHPGEVKGMYCFKHREKNMVHVVKRKNKSTLSNEDWLILRAILS